MTDGVPTGALLADLAKGVPELVRKEVQLLRAEMAEKAAQATTAVGLVIGGAVIALAALNVLAAALVAAIAEAGLAPGWSALLVGGAMALIALGLATKGAADLRASTLTPDRTARSLGRDAAIAKEAAR